MVTEHRPVATGIPPGDSLREREVAGMIRLITAAASTVRVV